MKNAIEVEWVDGIPYVFFTFLGGCRAEPDDCGLESVVPPVASCAGTVVYGRS